MLFVACCSLCAVCCSQFSCRCWSFVAVRCSLVVARCLLFVGVRGVLSGVCGSFVCSFVAFCLLLVVVLMFVVCLCVRCSLLVVRCLSFVV